MSTGIGGRRRDSGSGKANIPRARRTPATSLSILIGLLALPADAAAAELWVRPTHLEAPRLNVLWPATGRGYASFVFAVPDDLEALTGAKVLLVPDITAAGHADVFADVKQPGETTDPSAAAYRQGIPVSLVEDQFQEIDVADILVGLVRPGSAGRDVVSLFFWFPTGDPAAVAGRVLGMRVFYDRTPVTGGEIAPDAVDSSKVVDESLTADDIRDGPGSGLDADRLDGLDAGAFAASLHAHDDRYPTSDELASGGSGAAVSWSNLVDVPEGFADGVDDDTRYTPGPGLVLEGDRLSLSATAASLSPTGNTVHSFPVNDASFGYDDLTIGSDGLGLISFANGALFAAHCEDLACSDVTISQLDDGFAGVRHTSVAVGADGLPIISYYAYSRFDLKVAHCDDVTCSSATVTLLDEDVNQGAAATSIAIGSDGLPIISYSGGANGGNDLRLAHCEDVACTSATTTDVDTTGNSGHYSAVVVGVDGLPLIAYSTGEGFSSQLRMAHCEDVPCSTATITVIDPAVVAWEPSLTIGPDGRGLVAYHAWSEFDLKVAHCQDVPCSVATVVRLDPGQVAPGPSLTIGTDGLALISYKSDKKVFAAHCNDRRCLTSDSVPLYDAHTGKTNATTGADGLPLISYSFNGRIYVVHCGNSRCLPFFQPR